MPPPFLADILIGREAQIYKEQSDAPGGWEEFKSFRVITPLYSILKTALEEMPERKIVLIHGSLHEGVQPFRKEIGELGQKHGNLKTHFRYSEPARDGVLRGAGNDTGMIDAALIERLVPEKDADYFFCGPKPFMVNMYHQLLEWGIPASQVHFEFFGPRQ